jgi:hypothetical protein
MFSADPTILLTALRNAIDAGAGPGILLIYTATQPDPGAEITDQTLLAALAFNDPSGVVGGAALTLSINEDGSADGTGIAAWARITDSEGGWVADMDCGNQASEAALKLNSVQIVAGGTVDISSAVITA